MPSPWDSDGNLKQMSDRTATRWVVAVLAALVALCVVVGVVGWRVGWWFKEENATRQAAVDVHQPSTQTAWRDEAIRTITAYENTPETNTAARGASRAQVCDLIDKLDDSYMTDRLERFEDANCA